MKSEPNSPTLRNLAEIAGVSAMTVSRALRNHPGVGKETRKRLQLLAREQGYCPDPELGKLMEHLRKRRSNRMQGMLCSLESEISKEYMPPYTAAILSGARERALRLGFGWETFSAEEMLRWPKRMERVLRGRGVEGLMVLPLQANQMLPQQIDWGLFSVVAATHSVLAPVFRRVVPHHYKNMLLICRKLTEFGYRRIGLVLPFEMDLRVDHHYSSALAGFHLIAGKPMVSPCLYRDGYSVGNVRSWFKREKPDAIIVGSEPAARRLANDLGLDFPGPVAVVSANRVEGGWAGIDELPGLVGSMSVDLLGGMVLHRERGVPVAPTVLMMEGVWHDGVSAVRVSG